MERVVLADWLFTTPAVILQPISGLWMAHLMGRPLTHGWVSWALGLYVVAGACWIPVVWLQLRMLKDARQAMEQNVALPHSYWRDARIWFWLGIPAFGAIILIYWLMVFKPA